MIGRGNVRKVLLRSQIPTVETFTDLLFESSTRIKMAEARMLDNVKRMNELEGFDIVIVCTGNANQAAYWQQRLTSGKGSVVSQQSKILAVHEDWPGGAGNGE